MINPVIATLYKPDKKLTSETDRFINADDNLFYKPDKKLTCQKIVKDSQNRQTDKLTAENFQT